MTEEMKCKSIIEKHERDISKWQRMIENARGAIEYQKKKILRLQGCNYYVYVVFVDAEVKYVGKGKGDRYKHPISGSSSCVELNRDFFNGRCIEVRFAGENLTEDKALNMERDLLYSLGYNEVGLYNKDIPRTLNRDGIFWDCGDDGIYKLTSHACSNRPCCEVVKPIDRTPTPECYD
jgi:hypothetical protein